MRRPRRIRLPKDFPRIVCLCGSTRFGDVFQEACWRETLAGNIVLSIGVVKSDACMPNGGHAAEVLGQETVTALDELHKRKIDIADEILVLNVGGYIGESTRGEIMYAIQQGKQLRFWEPHQLKYPGSQNGDSRHGSQNGDSRPGAAGPTSGSGGRHARTYMR